MSDFQNANFIPFDHYVQKAKIAQRKPKTIEFGSRRSDFLDAVDVIEVPMTQVPEFDQTEVIPVPEVTYLTADEFLQARKDELIESKLTRAKNIVAAHAFAECLHAGFFPPQCQSCGK